MPQIRRLFCLFFNCYSYVLREQLLYFLYDSVLVYTDEPSRNKNININMSPAAPQSDICEHNATNSGKGTDFSFLHRAQTVFGPATASYTKHSL